MAVLKVALIALMAVALAMASDVEVDTEVKYTSELDADAEHETEAEAEAEMEIVSEAEGGAEAEAEAEAEMEKPKRRAANATAPVRVLPASHFMPKSRIVIVPKGDPRARRGASHLSAAAYAALPRGIREGHGRRHHRHHRHHHRNAFAPATPVPVPVAPVPVAPVPRAPLLLRSAAPTTSAKCAALKGVCRAANTCSGAAVHGLCAGAANIICCTPKAAAPARPATPARPAAPRAPAANSAAADCPVYANAPAQSLVGNNGVKYSVVRIAPQHFTGTADNTMTRPTACAFGRMAAAAAAAGIRLTIDSGFRTLARQQYFYACYKSKRCNGGHLAATPGTSNHGRGQAIDINTGAASSPVYRWLAANASRFGFRRTVPTEVWHWEYLP